MERSVEVTTGESVAFSYELAGLGSRFLAVFIDIAIQLTLTLGLLLISLWLAHTANAQPARGFAKTGHAVLVGTAAFAIFAIFFGYFIVLEWLWDGRTPGKRLVGIRVVRDGGFPLDFTASVVRNVVRVLEFGLGFYAVSAVATLLSPENRRLGDLAAGTIVVRERRYERATVPPRQPGDARDGELSATDRDLVRAYVARRTRLPSENRAAIAAQLGRNVRPKLGASFAHLDDDDLLVHLAATGLGEPENMTQARPNALY